MSIKSDKYVGLDNDLFGGMTTIGKTIRDARVFGLIDETETCEGWNLAGINACLLYTSDAADDLLHV